MPEHIQYQDDDLFNAETHHEGSDVPIKPLFWAIAIFIVFGVLTHIVLAWLYREFASSERKRMDPPATQVARPSDAAVPRNQPLLQPFPRRDANGNDLSPNQDTPVTDLAELRAAEDRALHTYGWVDRQHGVVRIPIDVAKDLVVQRGFRAPTAMPVLQTPAPPQAPAGNVTPPDTGAHP
jgi:hypothetical protein